MAEEESIYNLVPTEALSPLKERRYRSKFPPHLPPTSTTFGLQTTSRILGNVGGAYTQDLGAHPATSQGATFGRNMTSRVADTKRHSVSPRLTQRHECLTTDRRAAVPKQTERPILGLRTDKNFIISNAVNAILAAPAKPQASTPAPFRPRNYGRVPEYLTKIKRNIDEEYQVLQTLHKEQQAAAEQQRFMLNSDEAQELRDGLQRRWDQVHVEYQKITHIHKPNTIGLKRRKENCEKQLAQLEKDLTLLNKSYIFVDRYI